ncbi:hypothetical protein N7510_007979 [Penicillium lagena]|uniref:uncharacterized protein n=1 Tax=Penicillium lagena TaxID=94218 RepID=UPI00254011DC|nr:uncharacterized protein N7510_007979 [Penicillium lagena]KAJ5611260.1 hypothetical protein N7510_007979 [Penicillium lagena]
MATLLNTTALGRIQGTTEDGVTQYLGIKYATLKDRLADAELIAERDGNVLDATKDGPTTVSPAAGWGAELEHVQHPLPKKELAQSDVDCLNLNITVPSDTIPSSKLPVFFFIHGGGLVVGANSWPQFDNKRFVTLSVQKNLPILAVSINYRLGALGFLTSEDLRNAGYKANNGLRDQRVAMQWVQKHIRDFGGDPDNVTVAGMSAGAASVTYHLHSDQALFKRAISLSGSFFLIRARLYEAHEGNYQQVIAALGLSDATPEKRLKALLETPVQDLVAKIPPSALTAPAIDGDIVHSDVSFEEVGKQDSNLPCGKSWCQDLMLGDAGQDASILAFTMPYLKNNCAKRLISALHIALASHPAEVERLLATYGIKEDTPDDDALPSVLNYINDIGFFAPVLTLARGWRGNAHIYYFNEGNPWNGQWKGQANHILDSAYLFQNFSEFMTPAQQAVGVSFAEDFFKFCHGIAPWPAVTAGVIDKAFSARVYGPSDHGLDAGVVHQPYGGESGRRNVLFDLAPGVILDDLAKAFGIFMTS